ncbi:Ubiquitin-conjugating enzyme E2 U [Nowakowskiella sp. JEL0407]|nr:Ubiquitin-conjugating enzyme E2 U [Nowakowskiella sp. JEL0407]
MFRLEMIFDEDFNQAPPKVYFLTVPFHPNVDQLTGKPCLNILDQFGSWKEEFTVGGLLIYLQWLLANPCLENPLNFSAAEIYMQSPRLYNQLVRDCVIASRRIYAGLPPHSENADGNLYFSNEKSKEIDSEADLAFKKQQKIKKLSFNEYYREWKETATSIPIDFNYSNPYELMKKRNNRAHIPLELMESIIERQQNLWYGNFPSIKTRINEKYARGPSPEPEKTSVASKSPQYTSASSNKHHRHQRMEKIINMKNLYLHHQEIGSGIKEELGGKKEGDERKDAPGWEMEADELVDWSHSLKTDQITL